MMSNVGSDPLTRYRHYVLSLCNDLHFYNTSSCALVIRDQPACLDAVQHAYEQPSIKNRRDALVACMAMKHGELLVGRDLSDNRCPTDSCFAEEMYALQDVINATSTKNKVRAHCCLG